MNILYEKIQRAVAHFWETRNRQRQNQLDRGVADIGTRGHVTGGKQIQLLEEIAIDIILQSGLPRSSIHQSKCLELPGYYRPEKKWDLLVIHDNKLIAAIEFKSQVGPSFGNNFNNRIEEALGTATDLWVAFREGAFGLGVTPWLGYFFILEDTSKSTCPVKNSEPHFEVFPEFKNASYAKRYEIFLKKLILERVYNSTALILLNKESSTITEPDPNLSSIKFYGDLENHILGYVRSLKEKL